MSAVPDLRSAFHDLEVWLEKAPEGTTGEIARGVHAMTPRPRPRHAAAEGALWAELRSRYGRTDGHKSGAYGAMGISWLWLLDPDRLTVEFFENVRGQMVLRSTWNDTQAIVAEPFAATPIPVRSLF